MADVDVSRPGRAADLAHAVLLLTRLPLPVGALPPLRPSGLWLFPLVGLLVGAVGAGVFAIAIWLGLPILLAVLLAIAATVLLTGALHEDGFADFCDGMGGGRSAEHKLDIMRDSRLGTYGVVGLVLLLAMRAAALISLPTAQDTAMVLIASETLSRAAMLVPLLTPAARPDGLGALLDGTPALQIAAAMPVPVLLLLFLHGPAGLALLLAAFGAVAIVAALAWRQLGGFTGDVLGAAQQIALVCALCAATIVVA